MDEIIIPSMGEWYVDPLLKKGVKIISIFDASTFNVTLNCQLITNNDHVIVKAFEFSGHPKQFEKMKRATECFPENKNEKIILDPFCFRTERFFVNELVFLVRRKVYYTLTERLHDDLPLEEIEKVWICFQIINLLKMNHQQNKIHSNLHPDNILINKSLHVYLADEAPFKPAVVMHNRPNMFYHFFTTAQRTNCYLSPERICDDYFESPFLLDNLAHSQSSSSINDAAFDHTVDECDDIFSAGLILYYLFTGEHLFTFSSLYEYKKQNYDITTKFNKIKSKYVKKMLSNMLSLDLEKRRNSLEVSDFLGVFYPMSFQQIHQQMNELDLTYPTINFLRTLLPIFELFCEKDHEVRIVLLDFFLNVLIHSTNLENILFFLNFLLNFGKDLSSRITLGRILPYVFEFLDSPSYLLRQEAIRSITFLLSYTKEIDPIIQGIFGTYLLPMLIRFIMQQTEVSVKATFYHEYPAIVFYVEKFSPDDIPDYIKVFNNIIKESDPIILDAFIDGLNILKGCSFLIYRQLLPILISCMNSKNIRFKTEIILFIQTHYEHISSLGNQIKVKSILNDFLPGLLGIIKKEEHTKEIVIAFLNFIHWLLKNKIYNESSLADIFQSFYMLGNSLEYSNDSDFKYLRYLIYKDFPESMKENLLISELVSEKNNEIESTSLSPSNIVLYTMVYKKHFENKMHYDDFFQYFSDEFYTKYKTAPKFRNSLRVSNSKIIKVRPFFSGLNQQIAVDAMGNIFSCSYTSSEQLFSIEGITSILPHWEKSEMLISNEQGNFYTIDWLRLTTKKLKIGFNGSILSLEDVSPNVCVSISKQNEYALIDKRTQEITSNLNLDFSQNPSKIPNSLNKYAITPCCSCIWNQSVTSLIGYQESMVAAIDWRMPSFMFMKTIRNTPVDVCVNDGDGTFSVISKSSVSFYSPTQDEPKFSYELPKSHLAFGYSFNSGNLIVGDDVYYISNTGKTVYNLKDHQAYKLPHKSHDPSQENELSLHQHLYPITAMTNFKNTFATGDCNGFVHIWDVF